MPFDDSNKAFIQAFLARNVLTLDEAKPMLASIWSVEEGKEIGADEVSQDNLNSMISASNKALTPLDYEIQMTVHQDSRETYYALVNTTSDQLTQMATTLSNDEIAYVKRLLDEIFDKNNTKKREALCIHGKDALNLVRAGRRETQSTQTDNADLTRYNLTMNEGEATLAKLVAEGWLEKSGKGFYSLSPRGLMELKSWLVETYNDDEEDVKKIKDCEACKQIVTSVSSLASTGKTDDEQGQRCPTRECRIRLHTACAPTFFRSQRNSNCPACKAQWDGKHYVGEKAITTSESYLKGKRRSGPSQCAQANPGDGPNAAAGEDDEVSEND